MKKDHEFKKKILSHANITVSLSTILYLCDV